MYYFNLVPRPLPTNSNPSLCQEHYSEYMCLVGAVRLTLSVGEVVEADGAVVGVAELERACSKGHMMWVWHIT